MLGFSNIEDLIHTFKEEREYLDQREELRESKFRTGMGNYLEGIKRETQTLEKSKFRIDKRNKDLLGQIKDMYSRYESGFQSFEAVQRNTMRAKLNFNEYLVQTFPNVEGEIKKNLEKEKDTLMENLQRLQSGPKFVKKSAEYLAKMDRYEGMNLDDIKRRREDFEKEIFTSKEKLRDLQTQEEKDYLAHMASKYSSYDALKGMEKKSPEDFSLNDRIKATGGLVSYMPGYLKELNPNQLPAQEEMPNRASPQKEKPFFANKNAPTRQEKIERPTTPETNMLSQFMVQEEELYGNSKGFSDRKSKRSSGNLKKRRDPGVKGHQNKNLNDPDFENFE